MKLISVFKSFSRSFWMACSMELFERWAYYGMFAVLALYLTGSKETGALGFTQIQKGHLMGTVTFILYFLPVITGSIADKFGYKKVLLVAYIILSSGYFIMGRVESYTLVFIVFLFVAIGAALFKPVISATIARNTNDSNSSVGFGIFYMTVNIGAFVGPVFASKLRAVHWNYVFIMSSCVILFNLILLLFYKEPERKKTTEPLLKVIANVFRNIFEAIKDFKFVLFLLIIVGFWTMYWQLFFTLPTFIEQWVDTNIVYNAIASISPAIASKIGNAEGGISPEMLINIDAMYIILFQIITSTFIMKFKPLNAMISGILVCSIGLGLWFVTQNGMYLFLSIMIFSFGEMASSPKISEYIGRIAPKDKTALYMGTSFLPLAGGNFFAGILSGNVYTNMSDKISLLKNEVAVRGLKIPEISDTFTQNDYIRQASQSMGMNKLELTQYLWNTYHPSNIWMVFSGIGLFTALMLFLYDRLLLKSK
ncbi:MAG: MFS transporter [Bacteroidetes bacterium]|nr:MFS transporter [Bacteroidota bacterium]